MKERPITFTVESSQAITEERKTQTRRVLSTQPIDVIPLKGDQAGRGWVALLHVDVDPSKNKGRQIRCRYGFPGDRLWVREPWQVDAPRDGSWCDTIFYGDPISPLTWIPERYRDPKHCLYRATWNGTAPGARAEDLLWRNQMFMPRWASRTTLEITEVRAQRVQEITEADALAEGISRWCKDGRLWKYSMGRRHVSGELDFIDRWTDMPKTAREAYAREWDRINGKRAPWSSNPWVWAITFKLIEVRRAAA